MAGRGEIRLGRWRCELPGSRQVGFGKSLLARYPWWRFEPHSEWIEPHWTKGDYFQPYAAGISGEVLVAYLPPLRLQFTVPQLKPGRDYRVFYFDPASGKGHAVGKMNAGNAGALQLPLPPIFQDWVLVIDRNL